MSFEPIDEIRYKDPDFIKGKLCNTFRGRIFFFLIIQKLSDVIYRISKPDHLTKQDSEIVHISKWRFYNAAAKFSLEQPEIETPVDTEHGLNNEETVIFNMNLVWPIPKGIRTRKIYKLILKSKSPARIKPIPLS